MTEMNLGTYAAKRRTWSDFNPRELLSKLVARKKIQRRGALYAEFKDEVLDDKQFLEGCIRYTFDNAVSALGLFGARPRIKTTPRERQKEAKENATRAGAAVGRVRNAFLAPIMNATFAELAKMDGKISTLAKMGKPNQVVRDVLSEAAVLKVLNSK